MRDGAPNANVKALTINARHGKDRLPKANTKALTLNAEHGWECANAKTKAFTLNVRHGTDGSPNDNTKALTLNAGLGWEKQRPKRQTAFCKKIKPITRASAFRQDGLKGVETKRRISTSTQLRRTRVRVFLCIPDEGHLVFRVVGLWGLLSQESQTFRGWLTNIGLSRAPFE